MVSGKKWTDKINIGMIAAAVLGISLLVIGSLGGAGDGRSDIAGRTGEVMEANHPPGDNQDNVQSQTGRAEVLLEKRLANILSNIRDVGEVTVSIQLASGPEYEYALNTKVTERKIEEEDQGGGMRLTTENTEDGQLVLLRSGGAGAEQAVVVKELKPEVEGVLVVASGADNILVKENLVKAVQTLLKIKPYQVTVLTGKRR